ETDRSYTVKVENLGPSDNTGFTVTDTLAAGTSFVSATTPDCANSGGTVTCTSAGLASGASVTWTITAHVSASYSGTTVDNTAAIATSATPDNVPGNNSSTTHTPVDKNADLKVTKTAPATVVAGTDLSYTVKVENLGPSDNTGFTVTDTLAAGTSFVSATTPDCANSGGTVTCTSAGLASGASVTWTITAHVSASYSGTTVDNTAAIATSATPDNVPGNNSSTTHTPVDKNADLKVTKTAPATVVAGTDLSYTVKVENLGPSDNTGFTVTDTLAAGTSFVSATTPDCANSGGTVTCTSAGLASGASVTWTITAHVSASYSGTTVDNTAAIATSATPDN